MAAILWPGIACADFSFEPARRRWTLDNGVIRAVFELDSAGRFGLRSLSDLTSGDAWTPPAGMLSSPIHFSFGTTEFQDGTRWKLLDTRTERIARDGTRQAIVLAEAEGRALVELHLEMYAGEAVLRHSFRAQPAGATVVRRAVLVPWTFAAGTGDPSTFHSHQWNRPVTDRSFQLNRRTLSRAGQATVVSSGSFNPHIAYLALRYPDGRGLFTGWEFDGRASVRVQRRNEEGDLQFSGGIESLARPVAAGGWFEMPGAFVGLFQGDWDDAGYRVQRFTEHALAQPLPPGTFPWVVWDSWSYRQNLDEETLRRAAEIASKLGVELFVLDLGWARNLGDWQADPAKFPSGLRALSDYVHALGMRFGLHFALLEAAPGSPVLAAHPEWASSVQNTYFGAVSLCPSHQPVREWITAEAVRMIDEYNLDWILQDGENLVRECQSPDHTHAARDSNFSNAVDGINWIVREVQRARPRTLWENCEDGGNMLTFNMPRNYVTTIAADDSGPLTTRQAVHAMSYIFPLRYMDRYMPNTEFTSYITRSFMFGGPWIHMNRLTEMDPDHLEFAAAEVELYKSLRERLRDGRVYHLTARPDDTFIDVLESFDPATGRAILFAYRWEAEEDRRTVRLRGLIPERAYTVTFRESGNVLVYSGADLMEQGLEIPVARYTGEIVFVDPL